MVSQNRLTLRIWKHSSLRSFSSLNPNVRSPYNQFSRLLSFISFMIVLFTETRCKASLTTRKTIQTYLEDVFYSITSSLFVFLLLENLSAGRKVLTNNRIRFAHLTSTWSFPLARFHTTKSLHLRLIVNNKSPLYSK